MSEFGTLFVIAAASGTGKTSLVGELVKRRKQVEISISHTTRAARPGEKDGEHYCFVDDDTFTAMVNNQQFLEHANVFGNQYGTSALWVQQRLNHGIDVILEIDWQGAAQVRALKPNIVSIFILPPSLDALRERLIKRNQDDVEVIDQRMAKAQAEMSHYSEFDYIVINDDFESALADLQAIIDDKRLARDKQLQRHSALLEDLLK